MGYKFAFDLGSTSLGWSVVSIDENENVIGLEDMGVRIFPDGRDEKSKEPLSVSRRIARTSRVRHDRILQRKEQLLKLLKENNMTFSNDDERKNPYELRAKAITENISLPELGRVLFNLSLRRGFLSNRKELKKDKDGDIKKATEALLQQLNDKTLGQFLWEKIENNKNNNIKEKIRFSEQFIGDKIKDNALYPTREMYQDEFNKIWENQSKYYPLLTNELKNKFFNIIFYQRPLKPQTLGFCMFEDGEHRIYKAHLIFQKFRVLQTINQLKIVQGDTNQDLSNEQKETLKNTLLTTFDKVSDKGVLSFSKMKNILNLSKNIKFNLENEKRNNIYADTTSFLMSKENCFGNLWFDLSFDDRCKIIDMILDDSIDENTIISYLNKYNLTKIQIENILKQPLEEQTGSLSLKAIKKILPYLEEGLLYSKACKSAGYHHSFFNDKINTLKELPYYGELTTIKKSCISDKTGIFKITNVSVHIALNQLRLIVNSLIKKYGNPDSIAIELARDLKVGTKGLKEINAEQAKNTKENERIIKKLIEANCLNPTKEDIQKYKLWEMLNPTNELDRVCIYSGMTISITDLLFGHVQIEHILPYSQTFDDSLSNKTVSYSKANAYKGNRTPYEAFHESKNGYNWEKILERAEKLPANMRWRFNKDAMEKFNKEADPIARALNDTKYASRIAVEYLKYICKNPNNVYGLPGKMTSLFRNNWGLNIFKNKENELYRSSHIHHAIDAFVIACMTRAQLQKLSSNASKNIDERYTNYISNNFEIKNIQNLEERQKALFKDNKVPFNNFDMNEFIKKCENTIISYKPKLKNPKETKTTIGALHEDTAYSLLDFETNKNNEYTNTKAIFVCREFAKLKKNDRDTGLKESDFKNIHKKTLEMFYKKIPNGTFEQFIEYCEKNDIKKVKLCYPAKDISTYVPVFKTKQERDDYNKAYEEWYIYQGQSPENETKEKQQLRKEKEKELLLNLQGKAKKAYKWFVSGNIYCTDIYQINPNDKLYSKDRGKWKIEVITNYMATINKGEPLWRKKYKTARRIMRLKNNDQIILEINGNKEIYRIKSIGQNKQFFLRHNKDTKDTNRSFSPYLGELIEKKIRKIYVSPTGNIIDNGFNNKWSEQNDT